MGTVARQGFVIGVCLGLGQPALRIVVRPDAEVFEKRLDKGHGLHYIILENLAEGMTSPKCRLSVGPELRISEVEGLTLPEIQLILLSDSDRCFPCVRQGLYS